MVLLLPPIGNTAVALLGPSLTAHGQLITMRRRHFLCLLGGDPGYLHVIGNGHVLTGQELGIVDVVDRHLEKGIQINKELQYQSERSAYLTVQPLARLQVLDKVTVRRLAHHVH